MLLRKKKSVPKTAAQTSQNDNTKGQFAVTSEEENPQQLQLQSMFALCQGFENDRKLQEHKMQSGHVRQTKKVKGAK